MPKLAKNNGDDSIRGTNGPERLDGGNGDDTVLPGFGDDTVFGGNGDDALLGGAFLSPPVSILDDDDYIDGGNGNDTIWGGYGNDTVLGGNGDDLLGGNEGANLLTGGRGDDTFSIGYTPLRGGGAYGGDDTISDFGVGEDVIDLRLLNRLGSPASDLPFTFIGQNAFSGRRPEVRYRYEDGNTVIELNTYFFFTPLDTVADATITLLGIYTPTEAFFLL